MCPKPDNTTFEWEKALEVITSNTPDALVKLDEIEFDADQEITNDPSIKVMQKNNYRAQMRAEIEKKRNQLGLIKPQTSPPSSQVPQSSGAPGAVPVPTPPSAGAPPPPVPPPPPSGPAVKTAEQLKKEAEQLAFKKRVDEEKAKAKKIIDTKDETKIKAALKEEEAIIKKLKDAKDILNKKPAFSDPTLMEGNPPIEKLSRERLSLVEGIDANIKEVDNQARALKKDLEDIANDPSLTDEQPFYQGLLNDATAKLQQMTSKRGKLLEQINAALAKYDSEINKIDTELKLHQAIKGAFDNAILEGKKAKAVEGLTPEQKLNRACQERHKEFSDLRNFSPSELIKIKRFLYEKAKKALVEKKTRKTQELLKDIAGQDQDGNPKTELSILAKHGAELEHTIDAAIFMGELNYTELKNIVKRSLFEDENNPDKIRAPSLGAGVGLAGGPGIGQGTGVPPSPPPPGAVPSTQTPLYTPPTGPQKDISQIIHDALDRINVKDLYKHAKVNKKFHGAHFAVFRSGERPMQIKELQAILNQAKNLSKQDPKGALDLVAGALKHLNDAMEIEKQKGQRKLGDSRLEKVVNDLMKEINTMREAIGVKVPPTSALFQNK